jgi:hypothetical protein
MCMLTLILVRINRAILWISTVQNSSRGARSSLPAIVASKATAVPLYGDTNTVHSFDHTVYITAF